MADETSFCKHCKRSVSSATFTLHSTHCERFIQICLSCQEPIPKAQMEQHTNDVHKVIDCKDCKEKIERGAENDHMANHCAKRLIPCGYCEMQCTAATIQGHELACGSRTEMCDICKNHILIRMLKTHEELHKGSSIKPTDQLKSMDKTSGIKEVLSSNLESEMAVPKFRNVVCQNILQASAALPSIQHSETKKKCDTFAHGMEDKEKCLLPCEFCGTLYFADQLEKHQMACNWNKGSYPRSEARATSEQPTSSSPTFDREGSFNKDEEYWSRYVVASSNTKGSMVEEEISIPCEICGIPFPMSCLELHEIACKFSSMSTQTEVPVHGKESSTQRPASPYEVDSDYWSQYTAVASADEEDIAVEEISIPCENCGTPFPISSLDIHEISCKFSKDATKSGKTSQMKEKIGSVDSTPLRHNTPAFLPCSFCNVVISSSTLDMHEARCRSFSEQQQLRRSLRTKVQPALKKDPPKNTRIENGVQRTVRNNALLATENRLPTTPKIQQSQYAVIQLPNGQEILKKRNPSFGPNEINIGHVLGHGQPQELRDDDTSILHTAVYTNRSNGFGGSNFDLKPNGMETKKSMFNEYDHQKHPAPMNCAKKSDASGVIQKGNRAQKNNGIAATDHNVGMRFTKKPNAAFKNYVYQPDPENKLGGGNSPARDRREPRNAMAPEFYFRTENPAEVGHQNQRNGEIVGDIQQNARDYNNSLGARPKRPQRPADKF
ncbi:TRAF-type zinc finger domain-containing protein 1-like isoform X2 [Daphnia carinata]|uniref:TRAF-type zinc finger domain-containing protein 1-like isoform X2 n=1 Tax=Daphnia carinata TaxID=120202 RepID=UPI00257C1B5D|nr:TRAF-type zinc finger domain-containing protein 1-like isoform X2 [Daphnia carinata]